MKAIVFHGTRDVALDTVDDAMLEDPEDVVIEVKPRACLTCHERWHGSHVSDMN
jgi:threonine dehydrogenase-like Zn-dependent dehydrogenase